MVPKNVLITGANGYLGGHVVRELREAGHNLNLMDSHGQTAGVITFPPEKVEVVVHLGWYTSVGNKHKDIQIECLQRTKALVEIMYRFQPHFIFASSAAVYGNSAEMSCDEIKTKPNPNCYYSQAKALAEKEIHTKLQRHIMFRFGSMMGLGITRTKTELVVNAFAKDGWLRKRIEVWNPECWKPFIHVKDAAYFIRYAIEKRWRGVANCCQGNLPAIDIALKAGTITGAEVIEQKGLGDVEKKSCRMNCWRLRKFMPRDYIMRTLPETIHEFRDFRESESDRNSPWNEKRLLRI